MTIAIQYSSFGGPEVLEVAQIPTPVPGDGQVVVHTEAIGVNPIDWKLRAGLRPSAHLDHPRGVGSDAAGTIIAVGPRVEGWAVGDAVVVRGASGAYATEVAVAADKLAAKPESLDWQQAAALGVPVGTAYQALKSLAVGDGDVLVVHGASGGVGQAAVQFAVAWGATVIATASPANHERLRELGAIPVAYGDGLLERLREAAPAGITAAFDAVGTDEAIESSLVLVADKNRIGTIVQGAKAAGWGIQAWSGGNPVPLTEQELAWRHESLAAVAPLIADGRFQVEIGSVYPLAEAAEAHRESESGHVRGKIILVP